MSGSSKNLVSGYDNIEVCVEKPARGISVAWVKKIISKTLESEKSERRDLSVLLTGNKKIRTLNKKFLQHDYETDVISFGLPRGHLAGRENRCLGDVVVSVEMARHQARALGISFREELTRYLIHGTLHLLGYTDKKKSQYKQMHKRQEEILLGLRG